MEEVRGSIPLSSTPSPGSAGLGLCRPDTTEPVGSTLRRRGVHHCPGDSPDLGSPDLGHQEGNVAENEDARRKAGSAAAAVAAAAAAAGAASVLSDGDENSEAQPQLLRAVDPFDELVADGESEPASGTPDENRPAPPIDLPSAADDPVPTPGPAPADVVSTSAVAAAPGDVAPPAQPVIDAVPAAAAPDPVAGEPATVDPATVDPVAAEPVSAEPVSVEPVAADPVLVDPVPVDPVAVDPVVVTPTASFVAGPPPLEESSPLAGEQTQVGPAAVKDPVQGAPETTSLAEPLDDAVEGGSPLEGRPEGDPVLRGRLGASGPRPEPTHPREVPESPPPDLPVVDPVVPPAAVELPPDPVASPDPVMAPTDPVGLEPTLPTVDPILVPSDPVNPPAVDPPLPTVFPSASGSSGPPPPPPPMIFSSFEAVPAAPTPATAPAPSTAPAVPTSPADLEGLTGFDKLRAAWAVVNSQPPPKPSSAPLTPEQLADLQAAYDIANKHVGVFGSLTMQGIDLDDKIELWRAIKRIANDQLNDKLEADLAAGRITQAQFDAQLASGTLSGGPTELEDFVAANRSIEDVADHFGISVAELMVNVTLESNENLTIQQMAAGFTSSNLSMGSGSMYIELDGSTVRFDPDGTVLFNSGPEGTFVPIQLQGAGSNDTVLEGFGGLFDAPDD
jgi:hypothetical protein